MSKTTITTVTCDLCDKEIDTNNVYYALSCVVNKGTKAMDIESKTSSLNYPDLCMDCYNELGDD